jgi:hypothetical protein
MTPSNRPNQAIEVEIMPNKTVRIGIETLGSEQVPISEIVQDMTTAAIENTFGMRDRMQDYEDEEQAQILEQTTKIKVTVKFRKRRKKRRNDI